MSWQERRSRSAPLRVVRDLSRHNPDLPPDTVGLLRGMLEIDSDARLSPITRRVRVRSGEVAGVIQTVQERRSEFPSKQDKRRVKAILKDLGTRQEALANAEARRRRRLVTIVGGKERWGYIAEGAAAITVVGGIIAGGVWGWNQWEKHQFKQKTAYEQSHMLGETQNEPAVAYNGWRIAPLELPLDTRFEQQAPQLTINQGDNIKITEGNQVIDTNIWIEEYKLASGMETIRVIVPLDDPYDHSFGIAKRGLKGYHTEEWLISGDSPAKLLKMLGPDGKTFYIKIEKSQSDPESNMFKYILTPVTPVQE